MTDLWDFDESEKDFFDWLALEDDNCNPTDVNNTCNAKGCPCEPAYLLNIPYDNGENNGEFFVEMVFCPTHYWLALSSPIMEDERARLKLQYEQQCGKKAAEIIERMNTDNHIYDGFERNLRFGEKKEKEKVGPEISTTRRLNFDEGKKAEDDK